MLLRIGREVNLVDNLSLLDAYPGAYGAAILSELNYARSITLGNVVIHGCSACEATIAE